MPTCRHAQCTCSESSGQAGEEAGGRGLAGRAEFGGLSRLDGQSANFEGWPRENEERVSMSSQVCDRPMFPLCSKWIIQKLAGFGPSWRRVRQWHGGKGHN